MFGPVILAGAGFVSWGFVRLAQRGLAFIDRARRDESDIVRDAERQAVADIKAARRQRIEIDDDDYHGAPLFRGPQRVLRFDDSREDFRAQLTEIDGEP